MVQLLQIAALLSLVLFGMRYLAEPSTSSQIAKPITKLRRAKTLRKNHGLRISKQAKLSPGVTLLATSSSEAVVLLNEKGHEIHRWNVDAQRARLLPNGNIIVIHGSKWGIAHKPWSKLRAIVREYNWNGDLVWSYQPGTYPHHDLHRLDNGNTLFLRYTRVPESFKEKINDPVRRRAKVTTDMIYEVTPNGEVAWEWYFYKHFDVNRCGPRACRPIPRKVIDGKTFKFDWTHTNTAAPLPENKWYDAGDKRFRPGNILIMVRNWSMAFIIDKQTGDPVWEYHRDGAFALKGGHEVHMIKKGLPGAGNILMFNNGIRPGIKDGWGSSQILELNPSTQKVVWHYENGEDFFSRAAGSVQRLPNGNTLISEDVPGRILEVSAEKEIVWEYQSFSRTARSHRYEWNYCPQFDSLSK